MLKIGDVIEYPELPDSRMRILWFTETGASVAIIHIDKPKAMPVFCKLAEIQDDLESGRASLLLDDPLRVLVVEDKLNERYRTIRNRSWQLIKPLVKSVPDIFVAQRRGKLIRDAILEFRTDGLMVSPSSLYMYLRRYWQYGLTPNALLPFYSRCGGKGKTRKSTGKKRGKPRKFGDSEGINITEEIRRIFKIAYQRCYASDKKKKWTIQDVYDYVIENYFSDPVIDPETGKTSHVPNALRKQLGGIPTPRQFHYWADIDHNRLEIKRKRMGAKAYEKDCRGLLGTSNAEVRGPGDRYQFDATIADVYLVSRLNDTWIIGRPVIYVVIDVFSRMVVGLYVGLEGPSWIGAMMALSNTAEDKVEYCRQFGIDIEFEDWPCNFIPGVVLGDRGELEAAMGESFINNFNVEIENTPPYRADWKGIVEQYFHLLPAMFKKYVPGYIEPDYRQRGGTDYRLDATLNLDEFTRIIIRCVLHYNNHREIEEYDPDRDLVIDEVPAVPCELWEWGVKHRSGALRKFPQELVRFSLMPTDKASVTPFGIKFRNDFYSCQKAIEERWFDLARQKKRWRVTISYDPRDLDQIYLHEDDNKLSFHVCSLTERSRAFRHLSLVERDQQHVRQENRKANQLETRLRKKIDTNAANRADVEAALRRKTGKPTVSAASRTKAIGDNRAREKAMNRQSEAFRLGGADSQQARSSADVVPFPSSQIPVEDDYSLPTIDEIEEGDDNHD